MTGILCQSTRENHSCTASRCIRPESETVASEFIRHPVGRNSKKTYAVSGQSALDPIQNTHQLNFGSRLPDLGDRF